MLCIKSSFFLCTQAVHWNDIGFLRCFLLSLCLSFSIFSFPLFFFFPLFLLMPLYFIDTVKKNSLVYLV